MGRGRSLPLAVCLWDGASATSPRWSARQLRRARPKGECVVGITTAAPSSCRPAGGSPEHEPAFIILTCTTRARRVSKGGTKVHAASGILQVGHWRWADAPARQGVRAAPGSEIEAQRHCRASDVTQASCIRFHVHCPPVGVHPLSFLNDLIRPSSPSNPRSFGPSCRYAAARTTPLIGVPLRVFALRWRGRPGRLFWCSVEGTNPRRAKKGTSKCRT